MLNSQWLVRNGQLNFWMDNWMGCGHLRNLCPVVGSSNLTVVEIIDDRGPKIEEIQNLVTLEVLQLISESGVRLQ